MTEPVPEPVTLESLAQRVEALERQLPAAPASQGASPAEGADGPRLMAGMLLPANAPARRLK